MMSTKLWVCLSVLLTALISVVVMRYVIMPGPSEITKPSVVVSDTIHEVDNIPESPIDVVPMTLQEAMQDAARNIYNFQRSGDLLLYWQALSDGEPVVLCKSVSERNLTISFAERLNTDHKNEWLKNCLSVLNRKGKDMEGITKSKRIYYLYNSRKKEIAEAVYNLGSDPNLRIDAKSKWDEIESRSYSARLEQWHNAKSTADAVLVRKPAYPKPETIPVWTSD